jgi:hypothetical protein
MRMSEVRELSEQHRGHRWVGNNAVWRWTGDVWDDGEHQFVVVPAEFGPFRQKFGPRRYTDEQETP